MNDISVVILCCACTASLVWYMASVAHRVKYLEASFTSISKDWTKMAIANTDSQGKISDALGNLEVMKEAFDHNVSQMMDMGKTFSETVDEIESLKTKQSEILENIFDCRLKIDENEDFNVDITSKFETLNACFTHNTAQIAETWKMAKECSTSLLILKEEIQKLKQGSHVQGVNLDNNGLSNSGADCNADAIVGQTSSQESNS